MVSLACHDPDFDPAKESHQMALTLNVFILMFGGKKRVNTMNGKCERGLHRKKYTYKQTDDKIKNENGENV